MDQEIRSKGIGGSEVAAILGVDPYSSPYQIWLRKTGRDTTIVSNKFTEAGIILEDAVAQFFKKYTNYKIPKPSGGTYVHPKYSFAVGTPDRFYFGKNGGGKGVLECKTTQAKIDDPPTNWFCQLQWYLGILGMNYGALAWLERGVDFDFREYEYDKSFFDYMIESVNVFWNNNVLKDIPPDPIRIEDVEMLYSTHVEGKSVKASPEVVLAHTELIKIRNEIKALSDEEEKLVNQVKMVMEDSEAVYFGDKTLFSWKKPKPSVVFDQKTFKDEHPDLFAKYQIERETSRRFLIKAG